MFYYRTRFLEGSRYPVLLENLVDACVRFAWLDHCALIKRTCVIVNVITDVDVSINCPHFLIKTFSVFEAPTIFLMKKLYLLGLETISLLFLWTSAPGELKMKFEIYFITRSCSHKGKMIIPHTLNKTNCTESSNNYKIPAGCVM